MTFGAFSNVKPTRMRLRKKQRILSGRIWRLSIGIGVCCFARRMAILGGLQPLLLSLIVTNMAQNPQAPRRANSPSDVRPNWTEHRRQRRARRSANLVQL